MVVHSKFLFNFLYFSFNVFFSHIVSYPTRTHERNIKQSGAWCRIPLASNKGSITLKFTSYEILEVVMIEVLCV